jgi:hypothetical protein
LSRCLFPALVTAFGSVGRLLNEIRRVGQESSPQPITSLLAGLDRERLWLPA